MIITREKDLLFLLSFTIIHRQTVTRTYSRDTYANDKDNDLALLNACTEVTDLARQDFLYIQDFWLRPMYSHVLCVMPYPPNSH